MEQQVAALIEQVMEMNECKASETTSGSPQAAGQMLEE